MEFTDQWNQRVLPVIQKFIRTVIQGVPAQAPVHSRHSDQCVSGGGSSVYDTGPGAHPVSAR